MITRYECIAIGCARCGEPAEFGDVGTPHFASVELPYHGPGWSIDSTDDDGQHDGRYSYVLWAPRPDRPRWSACWDRNDSACGDFRRADTAEAALACFPGDVEGRQAGAALLAASRGGAR